MSPHVFSLVLASANPDKATEITDILATVPGLTVLPRPDSVPEVEETGGTLLDNARLKARAVEQATGLAAVADDTGLEVEALDGAPGVYSARFAGEHATYVDNVAKLLAELAAVGATAPGQRRARFRSVALVAYPGGGELWAEGEVTGTITLEPAGTGGFGYDPVFEPDGLDGRTFAQLSAAEKHRISHRGRAFRALAAELTGARSSP
ncbi:MAG: RdgB/HAM1 family non-canonical purine NTP pyrophosphatase [Acidimicrobiales bacterium]|jgi:XTP/dITP diphosphohydrolase